ncbi:MAG: hypothetical protein ACOCNB_11925, partial [Acetivibrio ethanolgignens]
MIDDLYVLDGKGLVNIALAESYFEKGGEDYELALLAGNGRMQAEAGGKTELVFVAAGILTKLSILNNHMDEARDMLDSFQNKAEKEATKLLPNIGAMQARMDLYTGRMGEVMEWLEKAPDEDEEFNVMERYRYLTKVRVYLATGRKEKAEDYRFVRILTKEGAALLELLKAAGGRHVCGTDRKAAW